MTQTIDESRAQLIADLQERAEELTQLNRIAIALTSEFDLQRLLQIVGINLLDMHAKLNIRQILHILTYCLPFGPDVCFP